VDRNSEEPENLRLKIVRDGRRFSLPPSKDPAGDVVAIFLRWSLVRAMFHRGYVLAAFLYFVVNAHLSPSQLTLLGTVMSVTVSFSDIPAGAWADAIGRRWSLVIGHGLLAAGMTMTGFVTAYSLIIATQVLWGLGWAFSGGADVAWLTDEFDGPGLVDRVLARSLRLRWVGGAIGMLAFGILGWAISLAAAIMVSGAGMALLGIQVALQFRERKFVRAPKAWSSPLPILRRGFTLAFRDREILLVLAATFLSEGASVIGWLFPKRLVSLGFTGDPALSWTVIGILSFLVGAVSLAVVEARIDRSDTARRIYALACLVGVAGIVLLTYGRNVVVVGLGMLLVWGIAFNLTRAVSVIWVNRRTTSNVRATVLSCLSQAESFGEIFSGSALTILAKTAGMRPTLLGAGALLALAGVTLTGFDAERAPLAGRRGGTA
jgi:MFS family permease